MYSLTVCLDSMSPFPLFFKSILLSFFSHILHQWYFLYLRITGQTEKHTQKSIAYTSAVREPRNGGERIQWGGGGGRVKQRQISIFVDDSRCFRGETTCSVRWETGNMQGFHLDLNLFWRRGGTTHQLCSAHLSEGGLFRR